MVFRDVSIVQYSVILNENEQILPSFHFSNTGNIWADSHCCVLGNNLSLLEKRKLENYSEVVSFWFLLSVLFLEKACHMKLKNRF